MQISLLYKIIHNKAPKGYNHRLIGIHIKGEEKIYAALKGIFGYERAMQVDKDISLGEKARLIVFSDEKHHKGVKRMIREGHSI